MIRRTDSGTMRATPGREDAPGATQGEHGRSRREVGLGEGASLGRAAPTSVRPERCGDLARAQLGLPPVGGALFPLSTWLEPGPDSPRACASSIAARTQRATNLRPRAVIFRSVTIPGPLVTYLRAGLKREISSRLAILQGEIDTDLDPETYSAALARLWPATALFELIGLEDQFDQPDVEVDLGSSARLLLKVLETQHRIEVQRLQDAVADGIHLPEGDVPDLGALVALIRQRTCA